MVMSLYLEHYLNTVQHLPRELQRNLSLIRDLDNRVQQLLKKIDYRSNLYLRNIKLFSPQHKKLHYTEIQNLFNKAKDYTDRKVQLASDSYDLVDQQIRRMDLDLEKLTAKKPACGEKPKPPKSGKKKTKKRAARSSDDDSDVGRSKKKKKKRSWRNTGNASTSSAQGGQNNSYFPPESDIFDMPVDPNEPTYCICNQVSYGEMIGCDNCHCAIEWFHFPCVGLTTKPSGEWYCPKCTVERKCKSAVEWYCPKCAAKRK